MEYKVLAHEDQHELSRVVTMYIRKGWHLYGPLIVSVTTNASRFSVPVYVQALIKQVSEGDQQGQKAALEAA